MAIFPQLERFFWFDGRLKAKHFPNASHLAEEFEISRKTAQRAITLYRDRLLAPIAYDPARKGYYYTEDAFELPRLPATQEELLALLVARRLFSTTAGGFLGEAIRAFSLKLRDAAAALGLDDSRMEEAFSASWHGYSPASGKIFKGVVEALVQRRLIEIAYHSPGSSATTRRLVEPHHLQHYMGSWLLIAWCRLRQGWRKFYLARIEILDVRSETFTVRPRKEWSPCLDAAFGIFQGPALVPVTLRFTPFRARWVREQLWHPAQETHTTPDGGLELSFPVADFREVKMMILQFGADVEVLAPEALREEIREEVVRMREIYRLPDDSGRVLPEGSMGYGQN
jgi:predicted DNA-binding transcriptional regulator YafY